MGRLGESVRRVAAGGFNPAWTPDGREIIYSMGRASDPDSRNSPAEIRAVDVTTGQTRRVVPADAVQPTVSPNGLLVAYWGMPVDTAANAFASATRDIWVKPLAGGPLVQITADESLDWSPAWAADGKRLYFSSNRGGSVNLWAVAVDERTGRPLGDPEAMTTPAVWAGFPSIAAQGSTLAYAAHDYSTDVGSIAFDPVTGSATGEATRLVTGSRAWWNPDVSPDGRLITLMSARSQEDIWVMRHDGTGLRNLTNDAARDRGPRFAADGSILFYSTRGGGPYQFWSIHPEGGPPRQLTDLNVPLNYPVPSPDGRWVAGLSGTRTERYIFNAARFSEAPEHIPNPPGVARFRPDDWSPDGNRIAALAGTQSAPGDSDPEIWVHDRVAKTWGRVAEGQVARWLPDGRRLLTVRNGGIALVDVNTGRTRVVYSDGARPIEGLALQRDGRRIYFTMPMIRADIWLAVFPRQN
jgi:Tol biopolymer transport system component